MNQFDKQNNKFKKGTEAQKYKDTKAETPPKKNGDCFTLYLISTILSIGTILGFIIGFAFSIRTILANRYFHYRMGKLISLTFQSSLYKWIIIVSVTIFILWLLIKFINFKIKRVFFLISTAFFTLLIGISSLLFFFYKDYFYRLGWKIKFYPWLRMQCPFFYNKLLFYYYNPMNFLYDVGIFLLVMLILLCIGLIFIKWKNLFNLTTAKYMRRTAVTLILFLVILSLYNIIDNKKNGPKGPNVIFIIIDTLRADHLSCNGYHRNTTPNIDKLSLDSIFYKNAISAAPWTTPSIASIFTAKFPVVLGFEDEPIILDDQFLTLAEIFKENNYKTRAIISHHYISSILGFHQGFDSYNEQNAKGHSHISSPSITAKAVSFLNKQKQSKNKFFLFLHYFDPHSDYILHENYNYYPDYTGPLYSGQPIYELQGKAPDLSANDIEYIKALYDSEISYTDKYIGKFLHKLKESGLYNDSLIILTSDHGEEFFERGDHFIGHGTTLYQEQIHVPLIIKLPGENNKKLNINYFGLIDLMPTIISYSHLKNINTLKKANNIKDYKKYPGSHQNIISETKWRNVQQSVIEKGWKLIYNHTRDTKELFNLMEDPAESRNLLMSNNKVLNKLNTTLTKWSDYIDSQKSQMCIEIKRPNFTPEQKEQLKSLGYLH